MAIDVNAIAAQRQIDTLNQAMGPAVLSAMTNPECVEVRVNADGSLWIDLQRVGRKNTGTRIQASQTESVIKLVADYCKTKVTRESPILEANLPNGHRFTAVMPPVSEAPTYTIRKRPERVFTLEEYVADGVMTAEQVDAIDHAAETRLNIAVIGGTGTGKTTLLNAILARPSFQATRNLIIETNPEIQCTSPDKLNLLTTRGDPPMTTQDLVRASLRLTPERIIVGECRGGEVLDMLKAWNTGHPGGLSTWHANSNGEALWRVEEMIGEVSATIPHAMIVRAVNVLVFISRKPGPDGIWRRRVEEVTRVVDHSPYRFERLA